MTGDILARLQAAQSDAEREWVVMEFSLANLEPALRAAVWAAAIPHWFDAPFLAALLDQPLAAAQPIYDRLTTLSYVEPFPGRGHNVHERTRALLLERLWRDDRERYLALSRRAAEYCAQQDQEETAWRVETIYHQLIGDMPRAASKFIDQGIDWHNRFEYEKLEALLRPVMEAIEAGRLSGSVASWAYYRQARLDIVYSRNHQAKNALLETLNTGVADRALEANCIQALGDVHGRLDEYAEARARYEEAQPIYRAIGDRLGEANCIKALGDVHVRLAEYAEARARYAEAQPIYRAIGDRLGEANCIQALGDVHVMLAEYAEARARYAEAQPIYRAIGARLGEANCIKALGDVHVQLSEYAAARARYEEAQPIYRAIGARLGEANCIKALGDVHVRLSEYAAARARYEEAQPIYRAIGARLGEANCIKALGDVHVRLSEYAAARARYEEAQPIYRAIGARLGEANCIKALGDVHVQLSEYAAARARYEEAQPIYRAIGARLGEANCIQALGDVSLEEGDEAAALAAYRGAFERYMALGLPNAAANAITAQATVYNRRKEYLLSLPLYSQAVELASDDPMWYRNRALCYINLKDAEHALADLETAARLQPDHPYLHARRGDVALLQGDFTAAAGHYAAFVEVLPRNPVGHFGLARALFGQRRVDEALASLRRSLELTYSRQEVIDRLDELTEMQADHPDLPGIEQGVTLLRERLASGRRTP